MALPRTSPDTVLFTTYNVLDLFLSDAPAGVAHYEEVVTAIRELAPDVLAVQEIRGGDPQVVGARLRQLAADAGMRCLVPPAAGAAAGPPAPARPSPAR